MKPGALSRVYQIGIGQIKQQWKTSPSPAKTGKLVKTDGKAKSGLFVEAAAATAP
jgi:hypothetical protein